MSNRLTPVIGNWYDPLDKGGLFQVVAIDEDSGTIEIQEFDGNLDELDHAEWRQMRLEEAAPPEDWTGPMGEVETDDLGYSDLPAEEGLPESLENLATTLEDDLEEDEEPEEPPRPRPRLPDRAGRSG